MSWNLLVIDGLIDLNTEENLIDFWNAKTKISENIVLLLTWERLGIYPTHVLKVKTLLHKFNLNFIACLIYLFTYTRDDTMFTRPKSMHCNSVLISLPSFTQRYYVHKHWLEVNNFKAVRMVIGWILVCSIFTCICVFVCISSYVFPLN